MTYFLNSVYIKSVADEGETQYQSTAFDAVTNSGRISTSPIQFNHICTGTDLGLTVHVMFYNATATADSATYNGVAMTKEDEQRGSADNHYIATFTLEDPATGDNQVSITLSGDVVDAVAYAISCTGVDTVGAVAKAENPDGNASCPITTQQDDSIIVDGLFSDIFTDSQIVTTGTNQTERDSLDHGSNSSAVSTMATTTAGLYTPGWDVGQSTRDWVQIAVEWKAAPII